MPNDLISRDALLNRIGRFKLQTELAGNLDIAVGYSHAEVLTRDAPAVDAIPMGAYEQVAWERDIAIQQLKSDYGVGLGEKKKDSVPVVRCKDCIHIHDNDCPLSGWARNGSDFCSYGERKETEQ